MVHELEHVVKVSDLGVASGVLEVFLALGDLEAVSMAPLVLSQDMF